MEAKGFCRTVLLWKNEVLVVMVVVMVAVMLVATLIVCVVVAVMVMFGNEIL